MKEKYFSIEIKTIFQAFRSHIPEYRSIQKCVSSGTKQKLLKPSGSTSNITHLICKQIKC